MTWARLVTLVLATVGAVPAAGFVVTLHHRGRAWRRSRVGRYLMASVGWLGAILAVSAASVAVTLATGRPALATWFAPFYLGAFVGVDVTLWRGWWLLTHADAGGEDSPDPGPGTGSA
jgi:hypothetical protein